MQVVGTKGINAGALGDVPDWTTDEDLAEQGLERYEPGSQEAAGTLNANLEEGESALDAAGEGAEGDEETTDEPSGADPEPTPTAEDVQTALDEAKAGAGDGGDAASEAAAEGDAAAEPGTRTRQRSRSSRSSQ